MKLAIAGATILALVVAHPASASDDVDAVANEAGVSSSDLRAALGSQPGVDARQYLESVGELARPVAASPYSGRLACIAWAESRNDPNATNRSTGASGLYQFLPSTWRTTPQGRAGLSPYDPVAATAAAEWMLRQGRAREWVAVTVSGC